MGRVVLVVLLWSGLVWSHWTPELAWDGTMRDRVVRELRRSVAASPRVLQPERHLARVLGVAEKVILVVEGRIFVSAKHRNLNKHKPQYHLKFLQSILESSSMPNFAYVFEEEAKGASDDGDLPFVAIAKWKGYEQPGVLVPNPYFANVTTWGREMRRLERPSWDDRDPRCLWRGAIITKECKQDTGNHARFCAVVRSVEHPSLIDARPVGRFEPRNPSLDPPRDRYCSRMAYDATMREIATSARNASAFLVPFMASSNFSRYQYLLNLPGVMGGSYSRNLNLLWNAGSVVLLWDARHVEWYYAALRHNVTHVGVGCDTLVEQMRNLRADPALALALRKNAKRVYDAFLAPEALVWYMQHLARALRDHSQMGLVLDDRDTRHAFFRSINCSRLFLLEVRISEEAASPQIDDYDLRTIDPADPAMGPCAQEEEDDDDRGGGEGLAAKLHSALGGVLRKSGKQPWTLLRHPHYYR
ncbi:hypothetical protein CTAYLR_009562 [Chrysophaeum taylorii]|uniref:Glycosyl transferase CAP10 domain-containing protein n=1 Tax=Chrysophaeum taylorii TaxID=2483200 RepID=A0AAD7XMK5_9STRA|nr:hypothetical protein CTAYLR_009562 [Chrysophaeum taylorii]